MLAAAEPLVEVVGADADELVHLPLEEVSARFPTSPALAKPCPPGSIITQVHLTLHPDDAAILAKAPAARDIEPA